MTSPIKEGQRVLTDYPHNLCEFGHQGLFFDKEFGLYHNRARYLNPTLGRFMQRDRIGYADGMNLYEYVRSNPLRHVDPRGLWGYDVHHDLTLELARKAGYSEQAAQTVATAANRPDTDERAAPSCFVNAVMLKVQAQQEGYSADQMQRLLDKAESLFERAREWHFPADPDGIVRPGSVTAWAKVQAATRRGDLVSFGEGLHVLQDSWAHQGKPFCEGIGHARGAKWVPPKKVYKWGIWTPSPIGPRSPVPKLPIPWPVRRLVRTIAGHYEKLTGREAFLSHSADKTEFWPEDARATGLATYKALVGFRNKNPGATIETITLGFSKRFSKQGNIYLDRIIKVSAYARPAEDEKQVENWLNAKYRGNNVVK